MVSRMASTLIGSEIIKIGNEVNEMIRKGSKICNLTIGDFDPKHYPIPKELEEEIVAAYKKRFTNYPPANGEMILRQSISEFLNQYGKLNYSTDEILVAGGSRPLIYATYLTLIDPGDKVVFPVPESPKKRAVSPSAPAFAEQCMGRTLRLMGSTKFRAENTLFLISPV